MNDRESHDIFSRCGDGTIVITALPEKKNYRYHATDAEGMYRKVVELGKSTNVYISVNPRGDDLPDGARGGDDDVRQLLSIIADCDVFGEARAEKELPPDKDSVISLLTALPIKPTRLDDSGYGIYAWYIFEEPYRITDEETLRKAKGITEGFGRYLASEFSKKGWKLDNVFSISHMFRAPGSLNHKLDTPVPCHMIDFSGTFYSIDDFEDYYKAPESVKTEPFKADPRATALWNAAPSCKSSVMTLTASRSRNGKRPVPTSRSHRTARSGFTNGAPSILDTRRRKPTGRLRSPSRRKNPAPANTSVSVWASPARRSAAALRLRSSIRSTA